MKDRHDVEKWHSAVLSVRNVNKRLKVLHVPLHENKKEQRKRQYGLGLNFFRLECHLAILKFRKCTTIKICIWLGSCEVGIFLNLTESVHELLTYVSRKGPAKDSIFRRKTKITLGRLGLTIFYGK